MRKALGFGLSIAIAVLGVSCGGDRAAPEAPSPAGATGVDPDASADASTVRLIKQRWIVEDACDDQRGIRVRLIDFTDDSRFPRRGYWLVDSGDTINKVIECKSRHEICLGAVQDPPPGLVWGVGMRGERYPCRFPDRCCFGCTTLAHKLTLSCKVRTSRNLFEGDAEGEVLGEEASSE